MAISAHFAHNLYNRQTQHAARERQGAPGLPSCLLSARFHHLDDVRAFTSARSAAWGLRGTRTTCRVARKHVRKNKVQISAACAHELTAAWGLHGTLDKLCYIYTFIHIDIHANKDRVQ